MRVHYISDLHLDILGPHKPVDPKHAVTCAHSLIHSSQGPHNNPIDSPGDILVICGDTAEFNEFEDCGIDEFLNTLCSYFRAVIILPGNHEYYNYSLGVHSELPNPYELHASKLSNLIYLNNTYVDIEDVRFIGSTFWTDMNNGNPEVARAVSRYMNDFYCIYKNDNTVDYGYRWTGDSKRNVWTTQDAYLENKFAQNFIKNNVTDKTVVLTHHAPSLQANNVKRFGEVKDHIESYGWMSDLDEWVKTMPGIKAWVHGHVHGKKEYTVGDTKVYINAPGYSFRESPNGLSLLGAHFHV